MCFNSFDETQLKPHNQVKFLKKILTGKSCVKQKVKARKTVMQARVQRAGEMQQLCVRILLILME